MIDVVSHADGRCLRPVEINDRLPLRARAFSFSLSHSPRKEERNVVPFGVFLLLLSVSHLEKKKGAPIEDDEVGGGIEKCAGTKTEK